MRRYLASISTGRMILWCYLLWYGVFAFRYFEPSPALWLTSFGISAIVGVALVISTHSGTGTRGSNRGKLPFWPTFRLFLMPFCVSSFSALVKGHGFFLIFSPHPWENLLALGCCGAFCAAVGTMKLKPR